MIDVFVIAVESESGLDELDVYQALERSDGGMIVRTVRKTDERHAALDVFFAEGNK